MTLIFNVIQWIHSNQTTALKPRTAMYKTHHKYIQSSISNENLESILIKHMSTWKLFCVYIYGQQRSHFPVSTWSTALGMHLYCRRQIAHFLLIIKKLSSRRKDFLYSLSNRIDHQLFISWPSLEVITPAAAFFGQTPKHNYWQGFGPDQPYSLWFKENPDIGTDFGYVWWMDKIVKG